jgi:glycosyltransferase involved in cell wall biosynthesis
VTASKPHALYIAWGFPPSRGSGVHRALATANGLVAAGFDVTVLTCERETFFRFTRADPTLEQLVHPDIDVVRIPFSWPLMEKDIRRWDRSRARDPIAWREARPVEDRKHYPETGYGPWRDPLLAAARQIHRRRPVDVTVATANPNVDVEAAHRLFLDHGVPFVMDQRDAWALDVFRESVTDDPAVIDLEAAYVRDAHETWLVNNPIRDWYADRYAEHAARIHVVANGFDHDLAPAPREAAPAADEPLTFGYVGTITPAMPVREFLEGWALARADDTEIARATADLWGYLGFFAGRTESQAALLDQYADQGVVYRGPIAKTQVRATYETFDALLLILGTGRYVTSGKVFEYMASALPVVSVHHPDVDASRVLHGYPLWFPARSLEPVDVAAAMKEGAAAARSATPEIRRSCAEFAATYDRRNQLGPRLDALREFATGRSER